MNRLVQPLCAWTRVGASSKTVIIQCQVGTLVTNYAAVADAALKLQWHTSSTSSFTRYNYTCSSKLSTYLLLHLFSTALSLTNQI
jgi:hypothetical protein